MISFEHSDLINGFYLIWLNLSFVSSSTSINQEIFRKSRSSEGDLDAFPHGLLSPHGECFGEFRAVFIRISGLIQQKPRLAAKQPLSRCVDACRINVSPLSRDHFPCHSFNVIPGRIPMCEFFPIEKNQLILPKDRHWKEMDFAYFYEKTCHKIPDQREGLAYVFDLRRDFRLKSNRKIIPLISTENECHQKCLEISCKAAEFDHNSRTCSFYEMTRRESEGESIQGVNYLENICQLDSIRCPNGRIDFIMARHSDVASFGIQTGSRSIRDCMRECITSEFLFCRSLQYDPKTNECFISEESSDLAVPSTNLDLFEAICLPNERNQNEGTPCNRPYAFEKLLTTKLMYTKELRTLYNKSIESCLSTCVNDPRCRAVNYQVQNKDCYLLQNERKVQGTRTKNDENFDYYEVACEMNEAKDPRSHGTELISDERTFLPENRHLQHVHIENWDECREACQRAVFGCKTFAFSATLSECHLSADLIERSDDQRLQINHDFDVFLSTNQDGRSTVFPHPTIDFSLDSPSSQSPNIQFHHPTLLQSNTNADEQKIEINQDSQDIFSTVTNDRSSKQKKSQISDENENETPLNEEIFASSTVLFTENSEDLKSPTLLTKVPEIFEETTIISPKNEKKKKVNRNKPRIFGGHHFLQPRKSKMKNIEEIEKENDFERTEEERFDEKGLIGGKEEAEFIPDEQLNSSFSFQGNSRDQPPPPRQSPSSKRKLEKSDRVNDPESLEMEDDSMPRVVPLTANVGHVSPSSVSSRAECHENGVNITFEVTDSQSDYTGAVYAAERFSQCRVFVKSARFFSIFVPRPSHNTWCNALEVDGLLSVVIVMSNDRVLPHDVTTKDDLFYQITCNYSATMVNKVQSGLVVGGPSPISIRSRQSRSFSLQIFQNDQPVESVFIGEKLKARVHSDLPPTRLRVTECTATRVGGQVTPATVQLIADGCALMPSIMGPMRLGEKGWEASLNAFRIDGSEQIDVVCLVVICQDESCPEANLTCEPPPTRSTRSLMASLVNHQPVRVDSRLEVLGGERESLKRSGSPTFFQDLCIPPTAYLPLSTLFLFCLTILLFSLCLRNRRKKFLRTLNDQRKDPTSTTRYRRQPSI